VNIDSLVLSWNPSKKQYTITMLTRNDELILKYAANMKEAITVIKELEEKYAAE
jgi:hypothetical protein